MRAELTQSLGLALALALVPGCRKGETEAVAVISRKVTCAPVEARTTRDEVEVRGTVAPLPDRDAQVAPQISGRILKVEVREGDAVDAGQVIARVDAAPLEDTVRQADAAVGRAIAEAVNAEKTLGRTQQVFERGIAPRQEVDDAATRLASARAAAVEAEAAAHQAHRQVERAVVKAPFDGVVLKVLRRAGELVDGTPATPVAQIADVSQLELVADVPAQDLVRLVRGARATFSFPGLPGAALSGLVSMVAPSVEKTTGLGTVRITLQPSGAKLPPVGLFGAARIDRGEERAALFVPSAAVRSVVGSEGEVVVCGADHLLHVVKVHVGATLGGQVEIQGELLPTAQVAVAPVLGLNDQDPLQ